MPISVTFDQAISDFTRLAEGADLALFYFAGHGFALGDGLNIQNYLMATSADVTSQSDRVLRRDGVPLNEIIEAITARAKTTLIFVDACRNDPRVRSVGGGSGRGLGPIAVPTRGDVFVGLSTRLGSVAADGEPGKGSPFARAFVANMTTPGLNVVGAFNRVRLAVEKETGMQQRPEPNRVDLADPDSVVLRTARGPEPQGPEARSADPGTDEDRAYQEWLSIQGMKSAAVFRAFAEAYPNSRYAQYALARLEELEPANFIPSGRHTEVASLPETRGNALRRVRGGPAAGLLPHFRPAVRPRSDRGGGQRLRGRSRRLPGHRALQPATRTGLSLEFRCTQGARGLEGGGRSGPCQSDGRVCFPALRSDRPTKRDASKQRAGPPKRSNWTKLRAGLPPWSSSARPATGLATAAMPRSTLHRWGRS